MNKPVDAPLTTSKLDDRVPYQKPQPWGMRPDMVVKDLMTDDLTMWANIAPGITSRPIHLNVTGGYYVHLLRVTRSGLLQRHRHSGQVHAYVIRGKWLYLEHDWVAEEGSYVFEPPGETHTLVVPDDCTDMVTLFTVHGSLIYVDPQGNSMKLGHHSIFATNRSICRGNFWEARGAIRFETTNLILQAAHRVNF